MQPDPAEIAARSQVLADAQFVSLVSRRRHGARSVHVSPLMQRAVISVIMMYEGTPISSRAIADRVNCATVSVTVALCAMADAGMIEPIVITRRRAQAYRIDWSRLMRMACDSPLSRGAGARRSRPKGTVAAKRREARAAAVRAGWSDSRLRMLLDELQARIAYSHGTPMNQQDRLDIDGLVAECRREMLEIGAAAKSVSGAES